MKGLHFTYPSNKIMLPSSSSIVDSLPTSDQLQQNNPETVHIWLQCQLTCHGILRCTVSVGAHDTCGDMSLIPNRPKLGQAKIRQLWMETFIQENVWWLEVSVYHRWICLIMQVLQSSCCTCSNLHPCVPVQSILVWWQICTTKQN